MDRSAVAVIGLGGALAAGCPEVSPYACTRSSDCNRRGQSGVCLADAVCAYPDDECASGWSRSPNASIDPWGCVSELPEGCRDRRVALRVDTAYLGEGEELEGYPLALTLESAPVVEALVAAAAPVVVTDAAGAVLATEVEWLRAEPPTLVVWVKLPPHSPGAPLELWLRWGDDVAAGDPAEVWSDYRGVWHLGDSLGGVNGDPVHNSARADEPGRAFGTMGAEQSVPGSVGQGLSFDGVDDRVEIDAEFVGQLDTFSASLWARFDGDHGDDDGDGHYFQRLNGHMFYPRCWRLDGGNIFCQYGLEGQDTGVSINSNVPHEIGEYRHIALVRDASIHTHRLYVDGELRVEHDDPLDAPLLSGDDALQLGRGQSGSFRGLLDEFRVSDRVIPEAWIRADVRARADPQRVLLSVGEPEPVPCAG